MSERGSGDAMRGGEAVQEVAQRAELMTFAERLAAIRDVFGADLVALNESIEHFRQGLQEPARHLLQRTGKRLRPMCVLMGCSGVRTTLAVDLIPRRRRFRIGIKGGFGTNFLAMHAPFAFVEGAYRLPLLDGGFELGLEVGAGASSERRPVAGTDLNAEVTLWSVPLYAWLTYEMRLSSAWTAYGGAGGGVTFAGASVRAEGVRPFDEVSPGGSIGGRLGADVRLGPGRLLLEATYVHAEVDTERLSGNAGGLLILTGYRFEL